MGRTRIGVVAWVGAWGLACAVPLGAGPEEGFGDCLDEEDGGEDARVVIDATEDSYHEMVVCGGLAADLAEDLDRVLVTSFLDAQGIRVPAGFRYDGEGGYASGSATSTMTVRYTYGRDYEAHDEGELVVENLYALDSYLRGVRVELDLRTGEVLVHWSAEGPLVELLGRGAHPANPFRLTPAQLEEPTELRDLRLWAEAEVVDPRPEGTVTYTLESREMPVRALLDHRPLVFDLTASSTVGADGSTLTASSPGVDYNDGPGTLTGDVAFALRGGAVDVDGVWTWADASAPVVQLTCR